MGVVWRRGGGFIKYGEEEERQADAEGKGRKTLRRKPDVLEKISEWRGGGREGRQIERLRDGLRGWRTGEGGRVRDREREKYSPSPGVARPECPAYQAVNRRGQCTLLRMLLHIIDKSVCVNERGRFDLMNHATTMTLTHTHI